MTIVYSRTRLNIMRAQTIRHQGGKPHLYALVPGICPSGICGG